MKILDRQSGTLIEEKVYGQGAVEWIHGPSFWQKSVRYAACRFPFFSWAYGAWQKLPHTRSKISPFVEDFGVDVSEFQTDQFSSFNDFFIRKLKKEARPVAAGSVACLPADARYTFFEDVSEAGEFWIKGSSWSLEELLGSKKLAGQFSSGVAVLARLAPPDYHRFHFPVDGEVSKPYRVGKALYSVNPVSLRLNPRVFVENKRFITKIKSPQFGTVLMCEVGATNVGSVIQTASYPGTVKKGEEKGYFSFGASAVLLLFEKGRVVLEPDLVEATKRGLEVYGRMGELLATAQLGEQA
jgi:phosphatidylserine decarboxylase